MTVPPRSPSVAAERPPVEPVWVRVAWVALGAAAVRSSPTASRAIALPLAAQLLAVSFQVYALFFAVPRTVGVFTIVVLVIATVQIVVTRPRTTPPVGERGPDVVIDLTPTLDDVPQQTR